MTHNTNEEWRPAPGYSRYEVSNLGRVRSRVTNGPDGTPRILRPAKGGKNGRYTVYLYNGTKKSGRSVYVHHLVAEAFLGPRPEGMLILHADDIAENNAASNLRYGTGTENASDRETNRVKKATAGTQAPEPEKWVPRNERHECPNGHQYTPENTKITKAGRSCLTCARAGYRRHRERKKMLAAR